MQGFAFAMPMPAADMTTWLLAHRDGSVATGGAASTG
jgi:hypothetical protein